MDNNIVPSLDDILKDILDDTKPLPTVALQPQTPAASAIIAPEVNSLLTSDPLADTIVAPTVVEITPEPEPVVSDTTLPALILPQFTADEIAQTMDLRNFGTLATLNTRRWHAKIKDRTASRDAAIASGADEDAFETHKRLLVGADDKLKRIHRAIDAARSEFYRMTLPWTSTGVSDTGRRSGARLLPNTLFFEFCTKMGELKTEMQDAITDFVPEYPSMIDTAKVKLGKRFDITDYPPVESIAHHFDLVFDFHPIPQGSDFKGLPQQQCEALARSIQTKTSDMLNNAMQDLWVRVHEAVGRMAERLSHPDKTFHHTLVSNVRDVAKQMEHLNVLGDPRIESLRHKIDTQLCVHEVEDLRKTPTIRMTVAAAAQDILNNMDKIAKEGL